MGDYLFAFAESQEFSFLDIEKDNKRNTTLAFVELDERGERRFSFYRNNTADYTIRKKTISKVVKADIVQKQKLSVKRSYPRLTRIEPIEG